MLRILGKATSINVRKVLWACEEIGAANVETSLLLSSDQAASISGRPMSSAVSTRHGSG